MIKIPRVPLYVSQEMALKYGNRCSRSGVPEKYTSFWDEYTVTLNGTECPVR